MPGAPVDIDLPLQSDNISDAIAKTADSLQAIETDLEAKVVAAEIDVNGNLDFNGWQAIGVTCLTLDTVADPTDYTAGSFLYSAGEFWLVTADGAIQATADGILNVALSGAIVGAGYGTLGAFVTFNGGAGQYEFTTTGGGWADGVFDDIVLKGALGETRLSCYDSLVGAVTLKLGVTLPGSNELVIVDSTGIVKLATDDGEVNGVLIWRDDQTYQGNISFEANVTVENGGSFNSVGPGSATMEIAAGAVTIENTSLNLVGTTDVHRELAYETRILPHKFMALSDSTTVSNQAYGVLANSGGNQIKVPFPLLIGDRVTLLKVPLATVGGVGTAAILVRIINADGTVAATLFNSTQATTVTLTDYTINITDHTLVTGQSIDVTIASDAARNTQIGGVGLTHTRP